MDHIAIDLGGRKSRICVRNAQGLVVDEQWWVTNRLGDYLKKRAVSRVVLETSAEAFAVADLATQLGHEAVVVPATLVRSLGVGARRVKTDKKDAQALSKASCAMDLPSVHVPSKQSREWKALCSSRECLVTTRTKLINARSRSTADPGKPNPLGRGNNLCPASSGETVEQRGGTADGGRARAQPHRAAQPVHCRRGQGAGDDHRSRAALSKCNDGSRHRPGDRAALRRGGGRGQPVPRRTRAAVLLGLNAGRGIELDARAKNIDHQGGQSGGALAVGAGGLVRAAHPTQRSNGAMGSRGGPPPRSSGRSRGPQPKTGWNPLRRPPRRNDLPKQPRGAGGLTSVRLIAFRTVKEPPSKIPSNSCPEVGIARDNVRGSGAKAAFDLVTTIATPSTDFHPCASTSANSRLRQLVTAVPVGLGASRGRWRGSDTSAKRPCLTRPPLHSRCLAWA